MSSDADDVLADAQQFLRRLPPGDVELANARLLLQRAVRKRFPATATSRAGVFCGVVTAVRRSDSSGALLWAVRYEDGDREELERHELFPVLVPATLALAAAPHGAEASERASPARTARIACAPGWPATEYPSSALEQTEVPTDHAPRMPEGPRYRAPRHFPMSEGPRYRGVYWDKSKGCWRVQFCHAGAALMAGEFPAANAADAAHAWDDLARKQGRLTMNFPRKGTAEVQCAFQDQSKRGVGVGFKAKQSWPVPQTTHEPAAGLVSPARPKKRRFVGVAYEAAGRYWRAKISVSGEAVKLGQFPADQEEAAARAYDAVARDLGRPVNFPIPGSGEVQAVAHWRTTQAPPAAGKPAASPQFAAPPQGPATKYVGITYAPESNRWRAQMTSGGVNTTLGHFPVAEAEAAARAYDSAARKHGRAAVNFPIPGSGEVQAVRGRNVQRAGPPVVTGNKRKTGQRSGDVAHSAPPAKRVAVIPLLLCAGAAAGEAVVATPPEASEQRLRLSEVAPAPASAELRSFIRGMTPPLTHPNAVLRAMRDGHVQLAHLLQLARCMSDPSVSDLAVERNLRAAFQLWGVHVPGDQMALRCALVCMPAKMI